MGSSTSIGLLATCQIGPGGPPATQSADFTTVFRRHRCGLDSGQNSFTPWGGNLFGVDGSQVSFTADSCSDEECGRNQQASAQLGQPLFQDGAQLANDGAGLFQEGLQFFVKGNTQLGDRLMSKGLQLEQQGLDLETEAMGLDAGDVPGGPTDPGGLLWPVDPPHVSGGQLSVSGNNTVEDGRYVITATDVDHGTITVTDTVTKESFTVYGDPHIKTSTGGTADFQHAPATFVLPDGTEITVTPTDNPGVNTIDKVTITKGNDAVTMTGFTDGHLTTKNLPGQGYRLDATTADGTVLFAKNGNIDDLVLPDGTQIYKSSIGNIDRYADDDKWKSIGQQLVKDGTELVQDGAQLVQEGQQLIQQGDVAAGLKLMNQGQRLEQQGISLQKQGERLESKGGYGGGWHPNPIHPLQVV